MYFKSLELIGFKSFADKTLLNFEPGVTAIVGPNGCGKSNIADGIRWVLGEQSAKSLRASAMEDVIFNGTDSKDPINFAEVSLTFSNEKRILPIDYDEVTITRRVFRSGDTEYLLNKNTVRLKDISELLMGTGIGTDSYSIIEQGKMDLILSSRPEDRRYVFEEASGITKYKSKKKEALRKLEQTEANLLRINDIIQEVKRQISSIERQARKAERYKIDFEKLKEIEVKLSFFDFKEMKTQEATHLVESEDLKTREKDLGLEVDAVSLNLSNYRNALDEISKRSSDLRTKLSEMSNSLNMNFHKIEIDKERIDETHAISESLKKELESINEKIRNTEGVVQRLKGELTLLAQNRRAKEKLLKEKEFGLTSLARQIEETDNNVKTSKVKVIDYLAGQTRIKNELIKFGTEIQNRKSRSRRLAIEKETVERELGNANEVLKGVRKEFEDFANRLKLLRRDLDAKKKLNEKADIDVDFLKGEISKFETNKAAIRSKVEILEEQIKRHEGYASGVKNIISRMREDASPFVGVIGVLCDLLKIKRGYEEAVDTFLGRDAQVIITEKDYDIARIIGYMKENLLGKATFISLECIERLSKGHCEAQSAEAISKSEIASSPSAPRNDEKGLFPLKDFVSAESRFRAVVDYFFRNAYLKDADNADFDSFGATTGIAVVTKSGLMFRDGMISGGSAAPETDGLRLVGRQNRLENLKAELFYLETTLSTLRTDLEGKKGLAVNLKDEISSLEAAFHQEDINFANVKSKQETLEQDAKKLKEELEVLNLEIDETAQSINELSEKGERLNSELNMIEKENSGLDKFIEDSQTSLSSKRIERENLALELATLNTESQSLTREEAGLKNNLGKEEALKRELEESRALKLSNLNDCSLKTKTLEDEIISLTRENSVISGDLTILREESAKIESEKSDMGDKLSIGEIQLKEKERELDALRNEIRDLDVKLTELNFKKTNLKDRIYQAYKVDLENTRLELEESIDWDALKTQIRELKETLEKMGQVNLVAIEEHKELEERYAFLTHQQDDLVNAKESLHKAIQKMNKTTKELFIETFQKIQVEFKNFFRLLFGGGQAELVLIDDSDILESGIEIIVRPPGKKLQNIMLLSGGEKALTAIALLFAIFKVKPSPFCVLDEIDAPLDESNITRFSSVLRDFLKMSQFIIITHNKRTIELADVMYGITMQERGVSKIVSVKFLDEDKKKTEEIAA